MAAMSSYVPLFCRKAGTCALRGNLNGIFALQVNVAGRKPSDVSFRTNLLAQIPSRLLLLLLYGFKHLWLP